MYASHNIKVLFLIWGIVIERVCVNAEKLNNRRAKCRRFNIFLLFSTDWLVDDFTIILGHDKKDP